MYIYIERVQFSSVAGARLFSLGKIQIIYGYDYVLSGRGSRAEPGRPGPLPAHPGVRQRRHPVHGMWSNPARSASESLKRRSSLVCLYPVDGVVGRAGGCPAENNLGWGDVSYSRKLNSLYIVFCGSSQKFREKAGHIYFV